MCFWLLLWVDYPCCNMSSIPSCVIHQVQTYIAHRKYPSHVIQVWFLTIYFYPLWVREFWNIVSVIFFFVGAYINFFFSDFTLSLSTGCGSLSIVFSVFSYEAVIAASNRGNKKMNTYGILVGRTFTSAYQVSSVSSFRIKLSGISGISMVLHSGVADMIYFASFINA